MGMNDSIATSSLKKPLVIVDAQNAAMRHGKNRIFSVKGIQIAIEYFKANGHEVICFMPEYLFNYEEVNQKKRMNAMNIKETKASQIPDNMALLHKLANLGYVIKTPPQDYDDSYCIQYAKKHNAFIFTCDQFRDFIEKQPTKQLKSKEKKWVLEHSVSFAFFGDDMIPNPDSRLFDLNNPYKSYVQPTLSDF